MKYRDHKDHQAARFVVLDTETTGLDPAADRVIEVAALEVVDGQLTGEKFVARVNPGIPINPQATAIHGITDDNVRDCPTFADIAADLKAFIGKGPLVGHWIDEFDKKFLREEYKRASIPIRLPRANCTLQMSQRIWWKESGRGAHSLGALADRLGVINERPHSAEDDARTTAQCYLAMLDMVPLEGVDEYQEEQTAGRTSVDGDRIVVKTPYCPPLIDIMRAHGGEWDRNARQWVVRNSSPADLLSSVRKVLASYDMDDYDREILEGLEEYLIPHARGGHGSNGSGGMRWVVIGVIVIGILWLMTR